VKVALWHDSKLKSRYLLSILFETASSMHNMIKIELNKMSLLFCGIDWLAG